jgi:hypothetical protein
MTPIHEGMRKAVSMRHRDLVRETTQEYQKRGNFIRIFPAKNSDIYDQYFAAPRPFNRVVYKALFTDEVIRCTAQAKPAIDNRIGYKIEVPPQSYEQFKIKHQQQQVKKAAPQLEEEKLEEALNDSMQSRAKGVVPPQSKPESRPVTSGQQVQPMASQS